MASWFTQGTQQLTHFSKSFTSTIDSDDNFIAAGQFSGTFSVDEFSIIDSTSTDGFICKMSESGEAQWLIQLKSDSAANTSINVTAITTDNNNNIYLTGSFSLNLTINTHTISSSGASDTDGFLLKLDENGNVLWLKALTSPGRNHGKTLYWNNQKLYLGAFFSTSFEYQSTTIKTYHTQANDNQNAAVLCLDESGDLLWGRVINAVKSDINQLSASNNNLYVLCSAKEQPYMTDLYGNNMFPMNYSMGSNDVYLLCLDGVSGAGKWVNQIGSVGFDYAQALYVNNNTVYCSGQFKEELKCKSQDGLFQRITTEGIKLNAFLCSYTQNGNLNWAKQYGTNTLTGINSITEAADKLLILLYYRDSITIANEHFVTSPDGTETIIASITPSTGDFKTIYNTSTTSDISTNIPSTWLTSFHYTSNKHFYFNGYGRGKFTFANLTNNNNDSEDFKWVAGLLTSPLSVKTDKVDNASFTIFPNPASTSITITTGDELPLSVKIIDAYGKLVNHYQSTSKIDVSFLKAGIYFIELKTSRRIITQQLIIAH